MKAPALAKLLPAASHGRMGSEKASQVKTAAKRSVGIRLGQQTAAFEIREHLSLIDCLEKKVARAEALIAGSLEQIEPLIPTIPGVSVATGAQIVAEIGDVSRFRSVASIVKYVGINSGVSQSGSFEATGSPITKVGSPYLWRALYLAAERARRFEPNLESFYNKKRGEGKPHRVAVAAVARKLCHIVYAIMRDQVPCNPGR